MEIRDPVHGNIDLSGTEARIIDTPEMQRLRYIKQLDFTYLIFQGANHTRFEHSVGTMQVTRQIAPRIYGNEAKEYSFVGLLHDIGHGPFSHLSELLVSKHLKKNHEQIGEEVIRNSKIKDIISDSDLSYSKIMSYFKDPERVDVVGGALGSDRIDYLMRDSYYTGVAYGVIDYDRIKTRLSLYKDKISISESGISGAESMLIARYFMFYNVYRHHAKTIANRMLLNAMTMALEKDVFDARELSRMYDEELIYRLLHSGIDEIAGLTKRIRERMLFKRAYYKNVDNEIDVEKLSTEIMKSGFRPSEFVADVIGFKGAEDDVSIVDSDGKYMGKLSEVSPFVKTLVGVLDNSKRLLVACDKKNADKINAIVRKFL